MSYYGNEDSQLCYMQTQAIPTTKHFPAPPHGRSIAPIVLVIVPLLHFLCILVMIALANKLIVKDDANFTTARLLAPIVQKWVAMALS